MGVFYPGHTAFIIFDVAYPTLLCFEKESSLLYQNPNFNTCYEPIPTRIKEVQVPSEIQVFPNPVGDKIYLTNITQDNSINIYNNTGQLQKSVSNLNSSGIDIGNLERGFYIYSVTDRQQNIKTVGKLIKE